MDGPLAGWTCPGERDLFDFFFEKQGKYTRQHSSSPMAHHLPLKQ
jgi:hypothetical protein